MEKTRVSKATMINRYVKDLSRREQEILLSGLKRKVLIEKARRLDKSIKKNQLTMEDIVEEVKKVRSTRI
jgi:hypothetical protein